MSLKPLSIVEAFSHAVETFGDAPLVVTPASTFSFTEIDCQSNGVARGLLAAGVGTGERIALYCPNVPAFVGVYLGIVKAGAVVVPVNLLIQPAEIACILEDAGIRGMLYHSALADRVVAFRPRLDKDLFWGCIGEAPFAHGDGVYAKRVRDDAPVDSPPLDLLTNLAAILYTSGATGHPKGAMLSHHNLVSNTRSVMAGLQFQPREDRLLVVLPMFHSFAATVGMLTPALHGLAMVPVPRFDTARVGEYIVRAGATVFLGVLDVPPDLADRRRQGRAMAAYPFRRRRWCGDARGAAQPPRGAFRLPDLGGRRADQVSAGDLRQSARRSAQTRFCRTAGARCRDPHPR
jgi:long-chain acyl-CoA synthetase